MDRLLSTTEAAVVLGWKAQTLRARRLRGGGPPYIRLGRTRVAYASEDLKEWLQGRRFRSTTEERNSHPAA